MAGREEWRRGGVGLPAILGIWPPGGVCLGSERRREETQLLELLDIPMIQLVAVGTQSSGLMFPYKTLSWSHPSRGVIS